MRRAMTTLCPYAVYCRSAQSRSEFLRHSSEALFRVSRERSGTRLHTFDEDDARFSPRASIIPDAISETNLNLSSIHKLLLSRTKWAGAVLIHAQSASSTQDILRRDFPTAPQGTVALVDSQHAGRGRRGASWLSPTGAAAFSILVKVPSARAHVLTFLQYVAALAAVDAVAHARPEYNGVALRVKWPNDVMAEVKRERVSQHENAAKDGNDTEFVKIGGVLCEASLREDVFEIAVGVGINVCNEHPTTCIRELAARNVTNNGVANGRTVLVTRERFIAHYLVAFEKLFNAFESDANAWQNGLRQKYERVWIHTAQKLRVQNGPVVHVQGLAPNGWVRVRRDDNGSFMDLPPDLTSLDLSAGVLKEKVHGR